MTVRNLSAADDELVEAMLFYLEESPMASDRFVDEFDRVRKDILSDPLRNPIYEDNIRVKMLRYFPFSIYYLIEEQEIVIVAIMHQARKPGYWKDRLG
jgi:plasmid stabilization system protein ParE